MTCDYGWDVPNPARWPGCLRTLRMFHNLHYVQDVCEPLGCPRWPGCLRTLGCSRWPGCFRWSGMLPGFGLILGLALCRALCPWLGLRLWLRPVRGAGAGIGRGWAREEAGEGCAARGERRCGERERGRCVGRGELHRPILFIREHLTILFIEWFKLKTYFIKLFTTHIQLFCTI